jgi:uncharacterized protein
MIAVDTNILVYAHRDDSPFHLAAYRKIGALAEGVRPWAIPWPVVGEFLSVITHPRMYNPPTPLAHGLEQLDAWLESPALSLLAEYPTTWPTLRMLLDGAQVVGPDVYDLRIAAICVDHGVNELWTADRALGRVPGLTIRNPLLEDET